MTEVVERTRYHVRLEDEDGNRRFVLVRCPVDDCEQRLVGDDVHGAGADELRAAANTVDKHLADHHGPECFGLSPCTTRARQSRLTALGGETA